MQKQFETAIIHIGIHKTGTSSIQAILHQRKSALMEHFGILYPLAMNNHSPFLTTFHKQAYKMAAHKSNGRNTSDSVIKYRNEIKQTLVREFAQTSATTLLFSGEGGCLLPQEDLIDLKTWLDPYVKRYKIIAWLRHPVSWSISAIQERTKHGSHENFFKPKLPHYRQKLETFMSVFGKENLLVIDFEKAKQHPYGIIGRFCEDLGIPEIFYKTIPTTSSNQSMSSEAALLLNQLNKIRPLFVNNKLADHRDRFFPFLQIKGKKFYSSIEPHVKENIMADSTEDLIWLKETFNLTLEKPKPSADEEEKELFGEESQTSIALLISDLINEKERLHQENLAMQQQIKNNQNTYLHIHRESKLGKLFSILQKGIGAKVKNKMKVLYQ